MNTRILPVLLMLLTFFIVGRVGLSWLQPDEVVMVQTDNNSHAAEDVRTTAAKEVPVDKADTTVAVLGALWLPSAEAAANIPIDEEKSNQAQGDMHAGSLQAAREKIKLREKELEERQSVAQEAEQRASKRIVELKDLETRIQDLLDQEKSVNDKKIKRLTAVYEGMKAAQAAPVIAQMDMDIVVKMFSRMNEKQVGKILSFLPPKQAVSISQALTKRIGSL